ncbi:MAG TPA: alpha/beta fold hydrolase [Actinomycetota bacterium]|nr:alpha/beta fold hydrolase [Actinomycetota bacterium]
MSAVRAPFVRALSHEFGEGAVPFAVQTSDGVRLVGTRLGVAEPAIVLCHGFSGWHGKTRSALFAEALAERCAVYAFDFRGHGGSDGETTFGGLEIHDVAAVVSLARAEGHRPVATVGFSMGGVAVIRHAALLGGADAVVAISAPARWTGHDSASVRRMAWLAGSVRGRRFGRAFGVRIAEDLGTPEAPGDVVDRIAPVPLLVVHGRDDHYFDEEEAWRLYRRAGEPKALWLATRFGHAEDGLTPDLAERVARHLYDVWGLPWPG